MSNGIEIFADSNRGVYIPQFFAQTAAPGWGLSPADSAILSAGPDGESYWDTWQAILDSLQFMDSAGFVWRLHHDGDLFAICDELMTDSDYESFFGEPRN